MVNFLEYVLLGIMLAAPVGPASLAVIQNGLRGGFWRAWRTGIGVTLADASMLLVVFFGLAAVMSAAWVRTVVWSLGALVLVYLGAQSLREAASTWKRSRAIGGLLQGTGEGSTDVSGFPATRDVSLLEDSGPPWRKMQNPVVAGYLVNISNPLAVVFWAGIYGSIINTVDGARVRALISGAAILTGILIWHTTMSILTHWGRRLLNPKLVALISAVAGLALILFGLRFAWSALDMGLI